jgi:hypothetical protein
MHLEMVLIDLHERLSHYFLTAQTIFAFFLKKKKKVLPVAVVYRVKV